MKVFVVLLFNVSTSFKLRADSISVAQDGSLYGWSDSENERDSRVLWCFAAKSWVSCVPEEASNGLPSSRCGWCGQVPPSRE